MRGELSSARHSHRHPLDWYVDEIWCARQLFQALAGFELEKGAGAAIWDPCCGLGNTTHAFMEAGLQVHLSDVVQNVDWQAHDPARFDPEAVARGELHSPTFFSADFLECEAAPAPCSIVFNPPYSYRKGILEACVRQALKLATIRVCALVPNKWLSSQSRYALFMQDHPPAMVLHLTQRPSMPPGDRIALMGNRAFRGGMIDYCWIVWDVREPTAPGETRTIWLPPLGGARHA